MNDLRIVFMGTPQFAVGILSELIAAKYQVVGVITAPDKPAGRGRKLNESAVKKYALDNNLTLLQPTNLKNEAFLTRLKNLKSNLHIVVAFRMLPKVVWQMPALGTFNLHASLLPAYRGAAPINWALINGENSTGTTTFFIDDKIDTGDIILQNKIEISAEDTAGSLHDKLMLLGATLVLETLNMIKKGTIKTKSQSLQILNDTDLKTKVAPKLNKENCKIDWNSPILTIHNLIRGLSPYPLAWTYIFNDGQEIETKIYKASIEKISHQTPVGQLVLSKKELKVAVKEGYVNIKEIKLAGKRKMSAVDLLNGFKFTAGSKVL